MTLGDEKHREQDGFLPPPRPSLIQEFKSLTKVREMPFVHDNDVGKTSSGFYQCALFGG